MERDRVYLLDIVEAAKLAISYVEGVTKDAFLTTSTWSLYGQRCSTTCRG